jgi:hypothetical protein
LFYVAAAVVAAVLIAVVVADTEAMVLAKHMVEQKQA